MRFRLLFCVFVIFGVQAAAAQESAPDDFVEEPILDEAWWIAIDNIVWLDEQTLLVEPDRYRTGTPIAYRYDITTETLQELNPSPIYLEPTEEQLEQYQIQYDSQQENYITYLSPFVENSASTFLDATDLIYLTDVRVFCEFCGSLRMGATYHFNSPENMWIAYPLDRMGVAEFNVVWAHEGEVAVVMDASPVMCCYSLYRLELTENYPSTLIGYLSQPDEELYAVSPDGNRVIYSQRTGGATWNLLIWQRVNLTFGNFEVTGASEHMVPGNNEATTHLTFAGANFVPGNPNKIVALHEDGIISIDLETNERTVINPYLNSRWISIGFFSPDNRYIAFRYLEGLYVMPTGITE